MLRSVWLKTLRDQRWAVLGWGIGLGLLLLATAAGWARAFPDQASRELMAREVAGGLSVAQVFYGEPRQVEQLGGFVAWRGLGLLPVLLGLFMVLAATGTSRGAEERGELEVVLSVPLGRTQLFLQQAAGLALALTAICVLLWLTLLLCGPAAGAGSLGAARAALAVTNVGVAAALFGAIGLLAAQLAQTRRAAAIAAGMLMFAAHIWNNLGLVATSLGGARRVSPLYLYSRSSPLADGHVDAAALLLLAALVAGCATLAGWLFTRRDLGGAVRLPLPRVPARLAGTAHSARLLGNPLQRGLRASLGAALVWGLALAAYTALIVGLTPAVRKALAEQARAQGFFNRLQRGGVTSETGFLSFGLFVLLPVLVAIFAVTLAASWASEERSGRLELELTCPWPRRRYFLERAGAALIAVAIAVGLTGAAFFIAAWLAGIALPWGRALAAVLLVTPVAGVVVLFGYAVAAWRPGPATAVVSLALALSYFLDLLAPLLGLPGAARELSIFHLYGQPLTDGVRWSGLAALLLLMAALALAGAAAFNRRDISR